MTEVRFGGCWLHFVELSPFARRRKRLALDDDNLRKLQVEILLDPAGWPVIAGTGSIRKARFSKLSENRGKSGSYRVLYVYFPVHGVVALVTMYGKNEQANIDPADKRLFKQMVDQIALEFRSDQAR